MIGAINTNFNICTINSSPAVGSVAFNEKTFIGLMEAEEGKIISELDYARGLSGEFVWQMSEDAVKTETSGWALVETEPIRYSLEDLVFQTEKVVSSEKVTLGTVYLERENNESGEVCKKACLYYLGLVYLSLSISL